MEVINKDILTVGRGIICHQVSTKGVARAGLAKALFDTYPEIGKLYRRDPPGLGEVALWAVRHDLWICNLAGQLGYGRGRRFTDYDSVERGLEKLERIVNSFHGAAVLGELPIYFPYGMGCGLGGGDWEVVSKLIESVFPDATICCLKRGG
jgi:hypothetical protein